VAEDPVLAVPAYGAGQHRALDVGAEADKVGGDIMGGDADELDAALPCFLVGGGRDERGQDEWWMLMSGQPTWSRKYGVMICM
jgi:hypothetical protein